MIGVYRSGSLFPLGFLLEDVLNGGFVEKERRAGISHKKPHTHDAISAYAFHDYHPLSEAPCHRVSANRHKEYGVCDYARQVISPKKTLDIPEYQACTSPICGD